MLYFIPAWYAEGAWCEQEQYWHARRMHTEFDDTVKHIQLFHRNAICPFQIALLSFAPNFRHFLHRQGVYHAPYWSCFDAIQCVTRKKMALLSYHNLKWPEGTEFLYTMFVVLAMRNGQRFAKIEFGEDGNLIEVEMYEAGKTVRKNIYDDRGFVSSSIVYKDGAPHYQDYLGEDGIWRIRCFFSDGHVQVNPGCGAFRLECGTQVQMLPFQKQRYSHMGELIEEVLAAYAAHTRPEDIFCAAVHPLHMALLQRVFAQRHLVLSLFEERNALSLSSEDIQMLSGAGHLLCDSSQGKQLIEEQGGGRLPACTVITPFDTRPDFGISQQIAAQKILVPVDGLEEPMLERMVVLLGGYLQRNLRAEVCLFTRQADYGLDEQLKNRVRQYLEKAGYLWEAAERQEELSDFEEEFQPDTHRQKKRWSVHQCVDELSVAKCLRMQRLIVDLRTTRDVYLRIIAISMGIPQILLQPSEFVASGENGIVMERPEELEQWLEYYLSELANWNAAMVAAYEMGKKFDTATQIKKWKGVIDSFGEDQCAASGNR